MGKRSKRSLLRFAIITAMIRTRDFFLFLTIVTFLLIGIGGTVFKYYIASPSEIEEQLQFVDAEEFSAGVTISDPIALSRTDRLADIRHKIAAGAKLFIYEEPPEEEVVEDVVPNPGDLVTEKRCSNYQLYMKPWNSSGLSFKESEGVRLLYRDLTDSVGTSTLGLPRELVVVLPMLSSSSGNQACISSDVVGITVGGTLIRNTEIGTFGAFGEQMLIGYALDGYPIYGGTAEPTDICGGKTVNSQYRYQANLARETIIQCYSGSPVSL